MRNQASNSGIKSGKQRAAMNVAEEFAVPCFYTGISYKELDFSKLGDATCMDCTLYEAETLGPLYIFYIYPICTLEGPWNPLRGLRAH